MAITRTVVPGWLGVERVENPPERLPWHNAAAEDMSNYLTGLGVLGDSMLTAEDKAGLAFIIAQYDPASRTTHGGD